MNAFILIVMVHNSATMCLFGNRGYECQMQLTHVIFSSIGMHDKNKNPYFVIIHFLQSNTQKTKNKYEVRGH